MRFILAFDYISIYNYSYKIYSKCCLFNCNGSNKTAPATKSFARPLTSIKLHIYQRHISNLVQLTSTIIQKNNKQSFVSSYHSTIHRHACASLVGSPGPVTPSCSIIKVFRVARATRGASLNCILT